MKNTGLVMKYFVLKPSGSSIYAHASRMAMLEYADIIRDTNRKLAEDLEQWVEQEKKKSNHNQEGK